MRIESTAHLEEIRETPVRSRAWLESMSRLLRETMAKNGQGGRGPHDRPRGHVGVQFRSAHSRRPRNFSRRRPCDAAQRQWRQVAAATSAAAAPRLQQRYGTSSGSNKAATLRRRRRRRRRRRSSQPRRREREKERDGRKSSVRTHRATRSHQRPRASSAGPFGTARPPCAGPRSRYRPRALSPPPQWVLLPRAPLGDVEDRGSEWRRSILPAHGLDTRRFSSIARLSPIVSIDVSFQRSAC